MHCIHCGVNAGERGKDMHSSLIRNIIDQVALMGGSYVIFTGGEPFLHPDIHELIEYAILHRQKVILETNGLLSDKTTITRLESFRGHIQLTISLDGFSPASHDWFRSSKGSFRKIMDNIDSLMKSGIPLTISTVLHRRNKEEIPGMIDGIVKQRQLIHRTVPFISRFGRGGGREARAAALDVREIIRFISDIYLPIYRQMRESGDAGKMILDVPRSILPEEIETYTACGWGYNLAGINSAGEFGICHRMNEGSPLAASFPGPDQHTEIVNPWYTHPLFHELRKVGAGTLKGICKNCRHNEACRGNCRLAAYASYHDLYAPYPICQQIYDMGLFPESALFDPNKPCNYASTGVL